MDRHLINASVAMQPEHTHAHTMARVVAIHHWPCGGGGGGGGRGGGGRGGSPPPCSLRQPQEERGKDTQREEVVGCQSSSPPLHHLISPPSKAAKPPQTSSQRPSPYRHISSSNPFFPPRGSRRHGRFDVPPAFGAPAAIRSFIFSSAPPFFSLFNTVARRYLARMRRRSRRLPRSSSTPPEEGQPSFKLVCIVDN